MFLVFNSNIGFIPNQNVTYSIPNSLQLDHFYLNGTWANLEGSMKLVSESGSIILRYVGKEVNIVTSGDADLRISIDGMPIDMSMYGTDVIDIGQTHVHEPRLYNIVQTNMSEEHTLEIFVETSGFEVYTLTFG